VHAARTASTNPKGTRNDPTILAAFVRSLIAQQAMGARVEIDDMVGCVYTRHGASNCRFRVCVAIRDLRKRCLPAVPA
jgi:hypothetical protein